MLERIKNKLARKNQAALHFQYSLDVLEPNVISGWAFKSDDICHRPKIAVKSSGIILWSAVAEHYREDLEKEGLGDGKYAFSITPNCSVLNQSISSVDLFIDDVLVEATIPFELATTNIGDFRVQLDYVDISLVKGWVKKLENNQYRAKVELKCGSLVLASSSADQYREDLFNAGIGDGNYGFSLAVNLHLFPSTRCECMIFVDGKVANIEAIILEVEQETLDHAIYQHEFSPEIESFTQNVDTQLTQLKQQIVAVNSAASEDDYALNGQLQVAMSSIAELSVRINVIEQVLTKHFSLK